MKWIEVSVVVYKWNITIILVYVQPLYSCVKCHKQESIQVRQKSSSCDSVWCLDGDQQQSPVFTAVTIHLGAGEGVALRFVTPVSCLANLTCHSDSVLTTLHCPKLKLCSKTSQPDAITVATKSRNLSMKNVDASVRDLNVFPEIVSCSDELELRCGVPLH